MRLIKALICVGLGLQMSVAFSQVYSKSEPFAHTYSIVAYDPETGDMGVAVQSHWFSVGTLVTWAEAGVGAIATQSFVNPAFGPQGLALLKTGLSAEKVVEVLISTDEGRDFRQLAVIDCRGNAASYTGTKCIQAAGNQVGENYSVQANLMDNVEVWPAMAKAFEESSGPLAERLLIALEAAEKVGGDIRGKQSAALLVVSGTPTGNSWQDRKVDIRVEDHAEPLVELRRIWNVHQAYEFMNAGDLAVEYGEMEKAGELYRQAESMFPDNLEMKYWHAIALANTGKMEEALPLFKLIFSKDPKWKTLTPRLIDNEMLKVSKDDLKRILKQ